MASPNTRLDPTANAQLKELKVALQKEFGLKASGEDIASALICGISVPQAAGMLIAYNKERSEADEKSAG